MATEKKTVIIDLKFDVSDFTSNAAQLNKKISDINKAQKELKKSGEEGSIAYQQNTEALRENKKELAETNKTISNLTTANKANAGSNEQLKAQLSVMTLEYNKLSEAERETGKRGKELKDQINDTTKALKGNEEEVGNNFRSVGDYEKANRGLAKGFGDLDDATGGYGSQLKALSKIPILLLITGLVAAFALLKKAFTRSEDGANKFAKAQAILGGIMTAFLDVIEKVAINLVAMFENPKEALKSFADFFKTRITNSFNGLLELLPQLGKAISQLFSGDFAEAGKTAANAVAKVTLGVEDIVGKIQDASQAVSDFGDAALIAANKAAKLADAEAALVRSQRNLRIIQLEFLKDAEKQRQIRDDEALSIELRIAANVKLGEILKEQSKQELAIANQALNVANQRIALEGKSSANLDERTEALIEIADINERITGQESEQLTNINSLNRDKLALLDVEIEKKVEIADRELQILLDSNRSKLEANKFLTEELVAEEKERLKLINDEQLKSEALKLEQKLISQTEFNDAVNLINDENRLLLSELEAERTEAKNEQTIVDLENQREIDLLNREDEFVLRQQDLDRQRTQEVTAAQENGADLELIHKKFDKLELKNKQALASQKLAIADSLLNSAVAIFGEESAAGKAFALAQATINTYQGITAGVALGYPAAIPAVLAASVTGFAAVSNITSTKAAKGGVFGGQPHSNGGTKGVFSDGTSIEVEKGELFAVINKKNTAMLQNYSDLNSFNGNGVPFMERGGTMFQDGGIALNNATSSVDNSVQSTNDLVEIIGAQPAPIVLVEEINDSQSDLNNVQVRATF
ncbi:MAG: hypothetical protein HRT87_01200 [Legionellales bacterium]|nr:hypothetical protein [Legionellales bacterium]